MALEVALEFASDGTAPTVRRGRTTVARSSGPQADCGAK